MADATGLDTEGATPPPIGFPSTQEHPYVTSHQQSATRPGSSRTNKPASEPSASPSQRVEYTMASEPVSGIGTVTTVDPANPDASARDHRTPGIPFCVFPGSGPTMPESLFSKSGCDRHRRRRLPGVERGVGGAVNPRPFAGSAD